MAVPLLTTPVPLLTTPVPLLEEIGIISRLMGGKKEFFVDMKIPHPTSHHSPLITKTHLSRSI